MSRYFSSEWLRVSRFKLTWVILVLWFGILLIQVNGKINELENLRIEVETGLSVADNSPLTPEQIQGNIIVIERLTEELSYPAIIGTVVRLSTGPGWFFVILYSAVMGGEDFTCQTLRGIFVRGVGRAEYILVRTLLLWCTIGIALCLIIIMTALSGPSVHHQVSALPISSNGVGDIFTGVMRAWLTFLPFIATTIFWTVLGRHAGPAMGVGIGLHTLERLNTLALPVFAISFAALSENGVQVPPFLRFLENLVRLLSVSIGYNAEVFLHWGAPLRIDPSFVASIIGVNSKVLLPSGPWRSVAFLAGYTAIFLGWAILLLRRRDVIYGS